MNQLAFQALLIATLTVAGIIIGGGVYCRYTGLTRRQAQLLWLLAVGLSVVSSAYIFEVIRNSQYEHNAMAKRIFALLLPFLALPLAVCLYRKWLGNHLTDAEKTSGVDGFRAWLGVGNVICAALIPVCLWQLYEFSLLGGWVLTFALVLAYPILNLASESAQPAPTVPTEDLSNEREKVLQLLEAGKINADESADLLNALGQSVPPRPPPASEMELSPPRKMVLIGAALLLVGFFLPWFAISPGAMLHDMVFQQSMFGVTLPANVANMMPHVPDTGTVQVHAGDIAHGLGWWILALGMVAAVLPFFATTLEATLQKKIILAALGVGVFLLIYLLSNSLRYANLGVLLALAGYALEVVGTLKERPSAR